MIRKIPGIQAWVLKAKDFEILKQTTNINRWFSKKLPLFDLYTDDFPFILYNLEDYYIVINNGLYQEVIEIEYDGPHFRYKIKSKYINIINKTWNDFYENRNKKA